MSWQKSGGLRLVFAMIGALAVLTGLWAAGYGIYMAFTTLGPWMGAGAVVSAIAFIILTLIFFEE